MTESPFKTLPAVMPQSDLPVVKCEERRVLCEYAALCLCCASLWDWLKKSPKIRKLRLTRLRKNDIVKLLHNTTP